jgi:hypothetical protein
VGTDGAQNSAITGRTLRHLHRDDQWIVHGRDEISPYESPQMFAKIRFGTAIRSPVPPQRERQYRWFQLARIARQIRLNWRLRRCGLRTQSEPKQQNAYVVLLASRHGSVFSAL